MKKIFIDTENISNYSVLTKLELSKEDQIILFLSENTKNIDYKSMHTIHSFNAEVKTILLKTFGKNSMDIQISTYIGLHLKKNEQCFIISDDKDFESTKYILSKEGYKVSLVKSNFSKINNPIIIDDLDIIKMIKDSQNKRDFHNKLSKLYGEEGKQAYQYYKKKYDSIYNA